MREVKVKGPAIVIYAAKDNRGYVGWTVVKEDCEVSGCAPTVEEAFSMARKELGNAEYLLEY